jgi:preprotein translocase subunit SecG
MGALNIIGGIFMILSGIGIMVSVTLQDSPKGTGVSALTGGESYYSKNQGRTLDAMLSKLTRVLAIVFFAVTVIVSVANAWLV